MQDRLTYANGNTITTEGFRCSVGEPIDIKVTVGEDEEVQLPVAAGKSISHGDYFITLEVNGEKAAYRDLYHLGEETVTVGDYTISDDLYLTGVSEDDEVVMRLEPVELNVTDAFRAAVYAVKGTNQEGGGGGGSSTGPLVIYQGEEYKLDKTWQEIMDAMSAGTPAYVVTIQHEYGSVSQVNFDLVSSISGGLVSDHLLTAGDNSYRASDSDSYPQAW